MPVKYRKAARIPGIHVPHRKHTQDCETQRIECSGTVTLPLSMHIGAPAQAVVQKGDRVFVGTLVGKATSLISANIHSSVSGTVTDITKLLAADGSFKDAVVIQSDGQNTPDPAITPPVVTDRESFVAAVRESGLVGLGGAGFPTHVKLMPPKNSVIDTLIVNAAECEPYITSDYREMMENTDSVIDGLVTVMNYLQIPCAYIGIESNKPRAIQLLKEITATIKGVKVIKLKSSYPQGAEKMLIANTVRRTVPIGKLPSDVGCIVLNVGSLSFINKYLQTGMPLVSRRITVDGGAVANPGNYEVPIGISIEQVINECGGYTRQCRELLVGGPMMGASAYTDQYPVMKNNNAILAVTDEEISGIKIDPCIHCGRCAAHCPMKLSPVEIARAFDDGDLERANKMSVMACVECGSCSFVCPAKRPVTQYMKLTKMAIRKAGIK